MDDRDRIIAWIAEPECKRIARKVVRALQGMTQGMQSGDDSGLANLWDEVCVQIQDQQSIMWEYYVELMQDMIKEQARMLSAELTKAIWLQTDNGMDWDFDEEDSAEIEYSDEDIVDYILSDFVLKLAADWNNRRIEKYMEREFDF
jgi:hypothetical protein